MEKAGILGVLACKGMRELWEAVSVDVLLGWFYYIVGYIMKVIKN